MTNQAAQTMPEPDDWQKIHVLMSVMEFRPLTDAERREMHAALVSIREVAALSQTAGVADIGPGVRGDMARAWLAVTETLDQVFPQWIESDKTGRECACDAIRFLAERSRIAATPAASGWDVAFRSCTCHTENDKRLCMNKRECVVVTAQSDSKPPSAASVSEDAAFEAWFSGEQGKAYDGMWSFARAAWMKRAALEQALTQQRGSDSDLPFATTQRVVRALLHLGHGVPEGQEEQYARSNELVLTLCSEVMASTTPQPGTEALRELVRRILDWQPLTSINKADRLYQILVAAGLPFESVTDELESLLGWGG